MIASMNLGIFELGLWCNGFAKGIFLYFSCPSVVILSINTRICIHWKWETAQKRWQSVICGSAGFTETDVTRFEWIKQVIIYSFQQRSATAWVAGITLRILLGNWLNGSYYLKNNLIPAETWQVELWSWHRVGGEEGWRRCSGKASICSKSLQCSYFSILL